MAALALLAALGAPAPARAERETTREALERLEELLTLRKEDGLLDPRDVLPAIVVSVTPAFEESRAWYPTAALSMLTRVFGAPGLRLCEACAAPRTFVEQGRVEQLLGPPSLTEIVRLDLELRGDSPQARAAIWLDENEGGVALRVVDLATSRIVMADNVDPRLTEKARSERNFTLARELARRARGDSLAQTFVDAGLYPGQHVSFDWTEQWGDTNANLSGVTLSFWDPVFGLGGAYYRAFPAALDAVVGVKVLMSVPTALVQSVSGADAEIIDPILSAVFVLRVPIMRSNYGVLLTGSTNGRFAVGLSLLNVSVLPVLP